MPDDNLYGYDFGAKNKNLPQVVSRDVNPVPTVDAEKYAEAAAYTGKELLPQNETSLYDEMVNSQSMFGTFAKGLGRTAVKVVEEVVKIPGYLGVVGSAIGNAVQNTVNQTSYDNGTSWDNMWLEKVGQAAEFTREAMPVYVPTDVQEGGIMGKLGSGSWWATTGADGAGFMISMLVPGQLVKVAGVGKAVAGTGLVRGIEATAAAIGEGNAVSRVARILKPAYMGGGSIGTAAKIDSGLAVTINTLTESAAEANNTYLTVRDQLIRSGKTEEEANQLAGNAASQVFNVNLGILGISNTIMERYVMKGFGYNGTASAKLKKWNPLSNVPVAPMSNKSKAWNLFKGGIGGFVSEGLWEEGMQTSAQQYFSKMAEEEGEEGTLSDIMGIGSKWFQNLTEMESSADSREFFEGAALGGILGGPMQIGGTLGAMKQEERQMRGTPAQTPTRMQKFFGKKERIASPGLVELFKNNMMASTISMEDIAQKDENGNIVKDANGAVVFDDKKIASLKEAVGQTLRGTVELAVEEQRLMQDPNAKNQAALDIIKLMKENVMLSPYVNNEGGVKMFESHVDKYLAKIGNEEAVPDQKELAKEKRRLIEKVTTLSKMREVIANRHADSLSFLPAMAKKLGATGEMANVFSQNVYGEKMNLASMTEMIGSEIKDMEMKQIILEAKEGRDAIEEEALKTLKARKETFIERKKEFEEEFKLLNNKEHLKEKFEKFTKVEDEVAVTNMSMSEFEDMFEQADPILQMATDNGYDFEAGEVLPVIVGGMNFEVVRTEDGYAITRGAEGQKEYSSGGSWKPWNGESSPASSIQNFLSREIQVVSKEAKEKEEEEIEAAQRVYNIMDAKERLVDFIEDLERKNSVVRAEMEQKIKKLVEYREQLNNHERLEKGKKYLKEKEEALAEIRLVLREIPKNWRELQQMEETIEREIKKVKKWITEKEEGLRVTKEVIEKEEADLKRAIDDFSETNSRQFVIERFKETLVNATDIEDFDALAAAVAFSLKTKFDIHPDKKDMKEWFYLFKKDMEGFAKTLESFYVFSEKKLKERGELVDKLKVEESELEAKIKDAENTISEIEKELETIRNQIEAIQTAGDKLSGDQFITQEELKEQLAERVLKSRKFADARKAMIEKTRQLRKEIGELEKVSSFSDKTLEQFTKFYEGLAEVSDINEELKKVFDALKETEEAVASIPNAEVERPDTTEVITETKEDAKRPNTFAALTGLHVMYDENGNDIREDGKLVFNPNPQSVNWYGFVQALMMGKMNINDYVFKATYFSAATLEEKEQINKSLGSNGATAKGDDIFVFAYSREGKPLSKNDTFVFAPMRNIDKLESNLGNVEAEFELFEKMFPDQAKKYTGTQRERAIARQRNKYQTFKNRMENGRATVTVESFVGGIWNREYVDGKPKENSIAEVFPELFPKNNSPKIMVSNGEEIEIGDVKYKLPSGVSYIIVANRPLILDQKKLSDNQIETIIHLYAMLYGNSSANVNDVLVMPNQKGESLITNLLNHGNDKVDGENKNGSRIFIKNGNVVFSIGKNPNIMVLLSTLNDYVNNPDTLGENAKAQIQSLKNFLATKYVYVNKRNLGGKVNIPYLKDGKIELVKVSYEEFLFKRVYVTSVTTDKVKLISPNIVISTPQKPTVAVAPKQEGQKETTKQEPVKTDEQFALEALGFVVPQMERIAEPTNEEQVVEQKFEEVVPEQESVIEGNEEMERPFEGNQEEKRVELKGSFKGKMERANKEGVQIVRPAQTITRRKRGDIFDQSEKKINVEEARIILQSLVDSSIIEKTCQ